MQHTRYITNTPTRGMATDAVLLVEAIGEEGERCSAGTWSSSRIKRMLMGSIAVALQRGNAMVLLSGYTRSVSAREEKTRRVGRRHESEPALDSAEAQTRE